jgi:hypothetical protein
MAISCGGNSPGNLIVPDIVQVLPVPRTRSDRVPILQCSLAKMLSLGAAHGWRAGSRFMPTKNSSLIPRVVRYIDHKKMEIISELKSVI